MQKALTATCTRDTVIGLASRLVINQPDAVSNIAVPTFETKLAVHITVNARWLNGPHREGVGAAGAAAVVRSAPKRISRRGIRAPREATRQSTAEHLLSYIPQIDDGTYGNSARSRRNSASHSGCAKRPDGTAPLSRQIGWICKRIIAG